MTAKPPYYLNPNSPNSVSVKESKKAISFKKNNGSATFQKAMMLTVLIGQFFGLNPVLGVCDADTSKMEFSYFSGRCVYTFLIILGQIVFLNTFCLIKYFNENVTSITSHSTLTFYVFNTVTTILFLRIATQWPKLCQYISKIEAIDPVTDASLVKKCYISCIAILFMATLEHILAEIAGFVMAIDCHPNTVYETFIIQCFPWINLHVDYTPFLGVITQFFNILCTFNWNFGDLFIISISFYLTSRLEQINKKISAVKGNYVSTTFWKTVREDYNRATDIVRRVDEVIGSVTFITFANNLVFICMQLLHTLANGVKATTSCHEPDERFLQGYEQAVYFTYSFIFLVIRALSVSLIAAQVHTASIQPVFTLYEVPSAVYCVEVQRFIEQIHGDAVALTGLQFFKVKRGIVLAIAGTIVTYELVLLQFTGITPTVAPLHEETQYKE